MAQAKGLKALSLCSQHCVTSCGSPPPYNGAHWQLLAEKGHRPQSAGRTSASLLPKASLYPRSKTELSKNQSPFMQVSHPCPSLRLSRTKLQLFQGFPDGGEGSGAYWQGLSSLLHSHSSLLQMLLSLPPRHFLPYFLEHEKSRSLGFLDP